MNTRYRLLSTLLPKLLCVLSIAAMTTAAHAEFLDLSEPAPVIQLANQNASWSKMPNFNYEMVSSNCLDDDTGEAFKPDKGQPLNVILNFLIDKQGKITTVQVKKGSGNACVDNKILRQAQRGRFKPFIKNGQPEVGRVTLPIKFLVP